MASSENLRHRFGHRRYVLWVDENRRLVHYFRNRRPVPCDHRSPACHGLQCRQSKTLLKGWQHKRSEEHTSELQSRLHLVCRLLLEKKKKKESGASDGHFHGAHGDKGATDARLPHTDG